MSGVIQSDSNIAPSPLRRSVRVAIACTSDKIFARLATLMGMPEVALQGRWGSVAQREAERDAVDKAVAAWTGARTREEVLAQCNACPDAALSRELQAQPDAVLWQCLA